MNGCGTPDGPVQDVVIETPAGKFHAKKVRHDRGKGGIATAWLSQEVPGLGLARLDLPSGGKMLAMRVGRNGESSFPKGVEPKTTMFGPESPLGRAVEALREPMSGGTDGGLGDGGMPHSRPAVVDVNADAGAARPLKVYGVDAGR